MRTAKMHVSTIVRCYHFKETGQGNYRKTVRVNTHSTEENFDYELCLDRTPAGVVSGNFVIVRLDSRVEYAFSPSAKAAFEAQGKRMVDENRHRDRHIEKTTRFSVPGTVDRQLIITEEGEKDWRFSFWVYFLSVILCLSPVYIWWFNKKAGQANFCITKKLFLTSTDGPISNAPVDVSDVKLNEASVVEEDGKTDGDVGYVHAIPMSVAWENEYWEQLEARREQQQRGLQGFVRR